MLDFGAKLTRQSLYCATRLTPTQLPNNAVNNLAVPELLASCSLSRGLRSVNQWHRDHSAKLSRNLGDAICCYFGVDSCTDRVIAGFWVGPDDDDGWGYVEAFINQTL